MKKRISVLLAALLALAALSGCGSGGEKIDYDLVFVNDSDATIVEVVADFTDQTSGARNANSCPLKWGETFGFEAGEYPVTLAVYDRTVDSMEREPGEIAQIVIPEAPRSGERWYVTAHGGGNSLTFTVDTSLPATDVG